jgi:hypothetical protein
VGAFKFCTQCGGMLCAAHPCAQHVERLQHRCYGQRAFIG